MPRRRRPSSSPTPAAESAPAAVAAPRARRPRNRRAPAVPPAVVGPAEQPPTAEQLEIITACETHLMVEAGAGSGKTTLLTHKARYEMGFSPAIGQPPRVLDISEIAAITFTRKAAGEIKERMRQMLLGRAAAATGVDRERWAQRAFQLDDCAIGTIDSFAGQLIRDYGALAGMETGYTILEPGDAAALYLEVAESQLLQGIEVGHPGAVFLVTHFGFHRSRDILVECFEQSELLRDLAARAAEPTLGWADVEGLAPTLADHYLEGQASHVLNFAGVAEQALVTRMERDGCLDHAHVIMRAAELAQHPAVQAAFQARCKLLFVDEFQDTNLAQVRLLFRLCGVPDRAQLAANPALATTRPATRLVLIGDPKQGIYGFRHADITMWNKALARIRRTGGQCLTLRANHRSRPTLNRFFDDCLGRVMAPTGGSHEVPYRALVPSRPQTDGTGVELLLTETGGPMAVAEAVAERIAHMLQHPDRYPVYERQADGTEVPRGVRPRDIAVLSRNLKGVADAYERALEQRGVRCYIYGGRGLYGRREVQDIAILLRAVADPENPVALTAYLRSPFGAVDDLSIMELTRAALRDAAGTGRKSLFEALANAGATIPDQERLGHVDAAYQLLVTLRTLCDRIPHDQLIERALALTGYRAFLAGAPDHPAGLRNVEKLVRIARKAGDEPLFTFVQRLAARVQRADPEDEAPLYNADDDIVAITTIHKAKGLEWPYVVLTGIDEGVMRRIGDEQPRLCETLGLAIPLEVAREGAAGGAATAEAVESWSWHYARAAQREYAEAKRLFYVAATRARDRFILAGSLDRNPKDDTVREAYSLASNPAWLHRDGVERWLRFLYPALRDETVAAVPYGPSVVRDRTSATAMTRDEIVVRREVAGMRDPVTPTTLPMAPAPVARLQARAWPAVVPAAVAAEIPLAAGAAWPPAAEARIEQFSDRAPYKLIFTASEVLKFFRCRWEHYYAYRCSISTPTLQVDADDTIVEQIQPDVRGNILHDYFQVHQPDWSDIAMTEAMEGVLLRHLPIARDLVAENAGMLMRHARHFLRSPLAAELYAAEAAGAPAGRETPFFFRFAAPAGHGAPTTADVEIYFEGQIDHYVDLASGVRIVDLKTGQFRNLSPEQIEARLDTRLREYEPQAAVYALGLEAALGRPVTEVVLFFTAIGQERRIAVTPEWLAFWRGELLAMVQAIRTGDYGAAPTWDDARCGGCAVARLCRPAGAPEDALVPIRRGRGQLAV